MGLDMYLYADKYVSRKDSSFSNGEYVSTDNPAFKAIVEVLNAGKLIDEDWSGMSVSLPVGYWRKANQIHGWIVDNCADGVDECQRIHIRKDKAEELVSICKKVLANPSRANELLEPRQGFFFGTYEIDEWYLNDIKRTIEIFEKVLKAAERGEVDSVTYQASW